MSEFDPHSEIPTEHSRAILLEQFADQPDDDLLWQTAYNWVETEAVHDMPTGIADDVPADELIGFAKQVRATPPDGRYGLTTALASNGKSWFDTLQLFSSPQIDRVLGDAIAQISEGIKFSAALDIGTGTGLSLATLQSHAEHVVGIDKNQALLAAAESKASDHTSLVRADITQMPFPDGHFDLATSSGVSGSLDRATKISFYKELDRVLAPHGVYLEGSYWTDDGGNPGPELGLTTKTSKGMLCDMIVDTVSGRITLTDELGYDEEIALLDSLGLDRIQYLYDDHESSAQSVITQITKQRA